MGEPPRQPGKKGFETLDFARRVKKNRVRNRLARAARKKNRGN